MQSNRRSKATQMSSLRSFHFLFHRALPALHRAPQILLPVLPALHQVLHIPHRALPVKLLSASSPLKKVTSYPLQKESYFSRFPESRPYSGMSQQKNGLPGLSHPSSSQVLLRDTRMHEGT